MKRNSTVNRLLILVVLLGIGAMFGCGVLIISPSGKLFGIPLAILDNSPFNNFLIPGIILFCVIGVASLGIVFSLIKRPENKSAELFNFFKDMYWAWSYSIYIAFALIIWIQIEMSFVQSVHWSHTLYMCCAIAIIFFALLPQVRNQYKK